MAGNPTGLKPLDIKCTDSDCEHGLHCFRPSRKMKKEGRIGPCRDCSADLVDWARVHRRNPGDVDYTMSSLQLEEVRAAFWAKPLDARAVAKARNLGYSGLETEALKLLAKSVGPAEPLFDGRQTPKEGNVVYYGQHATAACCRKCIQIWHGIPVGRPLTEDQLKYLSGLVMEFIRRRLPDLNSQPSLWSQ